MHHRGREASALLPPQQPGIYPDEVVGTRLDLATGKPEFEDKINKDAGDFHGCFSEVYLGDFIAYYDLWVNKQTLETSKPGMPHPACFFGSSVASGLVYTSRAVRAARSARSERRTRSRRGRPPPARLRKSGAAPAARETGPDDWPMFRGAPAGGNASPAKPGQNLAKLWEARIGLGKSSFGVMSSQRTGLSQAVLGYGLAIVADIDGQRIVALDAASGQPKWAYARGLPRGLPAHALQGALPCGGPGRLASTPSTRPRVCWYTG